MMRHHDRTLSILGLSAAALLAMPAGASLPASAQTYEAALQLSADDPDDESESFPGAPEEPAELGATYARLLYFEGGMSLRRPADLRVPGADVTVNTPLVPGDEIWTGADGRAEIQLSDGSILRLDRDARLSLLNLSDLGGAFDTTTLLRLPNGSLYVSVTNFDARQRRFQIDTPAGSIFLLSDGIFRVDVASSGTATIASYRGVAELLVDQTSVIVHSGERLSASPGRPPGDASAFNTLRQDGFDTWAESRDDAIASARSARGPDPEQLPDPVRPYVSELSGYGTWQDTPEYGWIWVPSGSAPDWSPYAYGRWAWAPIGMVWISSEPWGYAPYHYGRWHWNVGLGWFWAPGYIYSGAYVQWAVGPSWYGWAPLGYYGYPFAYGGYYGPYHCWNYVPYGYIYDHHVHHHYYSYSDVAKHRMHDRSEYLSSYPRAHPRYRPERTGEAVYERARKGRGVVPRPSENPSQQAGFKDREQREFRRRAALRSEESPSRARPNDAVRAGRSGATGGSGPSARPGSEPRSGAMTSRPAVRSQADAPRGNAVTGRPAVRPKPKTEAPGNAVRREQVRETRTPSRTIQPSRVSNDGGRMVPPAERRSPVSGQVLKPATRRPPAADRTAGRGASSPSSGDRLDRGRPAQGRSPAIRQEPSTDGSRPALRVPAPRSHVVRTQPHKLSTVTRTRSQSQFVMVPRQGSAQAGGSSSRMSSPGRAASPKATVGRGGAPGGGGAKASAGAARGSGRGSQGGKGGGKK